MKLHIQMLIYLRTETTICFMQIQTRAVFDIQIINWVNDRDNWMKYFDILFGLGLQGESWYNTRLCYKLLQRVAGSSQQWERVVELTKTKYPIF